MKKALQVNETENRDIYFLGAGFTKAFFPKSPLLIDQYNLSDISSKYKKFDTAFRILDFEIHRRDDGKVNIEQLITRLQDGMPYDSHIGSEQELVMLLKDIKIHLLQIIEEAKQETNYSNDLREFAEYCVNKKINIITSNFDDTIDEAICSIKGDVAETDEPYWNPDGGYGFFCRPSSCMIEDQNVQMDLNPAIKLLKLHGSINWRITKGSSLPYSMNTIVHHEKWYKPNKFAKSCNTIDLHLESDPLIVPPTLNKGQFYEQPILESVWYLAYKLLLKAQQVTFIGCSFSTTDVLMRTLLSEALTTVNPEDIFVVNLAVTNEEKQAVRHIYDDIFGNLGIEQYNFNGALEWSRQIIKNLK